jgi:serine/threonine protein kinase
MLEAVQAVHQENVVHTDLKPANFVLVKGRLKIIDFGIAKAVANDTVNIQRDQQVCSSLSHKLMNRLARSTTCRQKLYNA